jgi:small conductance mechanosensitive channel
VPFLSGLVHALVIALVVIAVLGLFNVPTASFVAVLGAAGLAIGLALQGTLSNFAAGVMLLTFRPFKVGQFVEVSGVSGTVQAIGLFSTSLNTPDNVHVTVPNGEVFGKLIKNYSANDIRRIDMVVGVSYDDDLEEARAAIERIVKGDARVLADPGPTIEVAEMADSSVNFVVRPWVATADYWPTRFALTRALKEGVEAAGCSIPFPQRDIHLHQATG